MFTRKRLTTVCAAALAAATIASQAPAQAATTVTVGIASKPQVTSWGVVYRFIHQGGSLTLIGAVRPARTAKLVLQFSLDNKTWTSQVAKTTDAAGNTSVVFKPPVTRFYRWVFPRSGTIPTAVSTSVRPIIFPAYTNFPNCAALNRYYIHGVGLPNAADRTSGTPVRNFLPSNIQYAFSNGTKGTDLDRDNDGIACER